MIGALNDKHAVAIGKEPVALMDGFLIVAHDQVVTGEGRDEHQKRGLGQVEIREKPVDHMELESRVDE